MTPDKVAGRFFDDCENSGLSTQDIGMTIALLLSTFCYNCSQHNKLDAAISIQAIAVDATAFLKNIETRH